MFLCLLVSLSPLFLSLSLPLSLKINGKKISLVKIKIKINQGRCGGSILGSPGNQIFVVLQESNEFLSLGNIEATISKPQLPFPIFSNVYGYANTRRGS